MTAAIARAVQARVLLWHVWSSVLLEHRDSIERIGAFAREHTG